MGSSSSSGIPSEVGTSNGSSLAPLLWGSLGITALLVGVSGAIIALPDPSTTQQPYGRPKMKTSDEAAKDAKKRLEKWHHEQANKYKYHLKDSTLNPDQKKLMVRVFCKLYIIKQKRKINTSVLTKGT